MQDTPLYRRIYGSLVGGIIGDAMGAPGEGKTYQQIEEAHGWVQDFEGVGTDDTVIKHILCEAIIQHDGDITADEFAASFVKNKDKIRYWYIPVRNMFHKIESGLELPVYAGLGNMQSSSSAMSISPMGLINACNPRQAALETYDVAGLIHAGCSTFCRDAACAMAAAVAEAMRPGATVDQVLDASARYLHPTSSQGMREAIDTGLGMAREKGDYKAFREAYYATRLRDIISDSRETVPCSLALLHLAEGDPRRAIEYAANFGRDADTIATMTGALVGALHGVDALPEAWV
ncbi:MAG: ADP-ribosylglycohydrolase family protein, partial [Chloroflexi bacterium]|nr:ADP-ribosylglycohydrolase family protein [Chloroflexota bacterium]